MEKNFLNVEDIIADERFQSWYFKANESQRNDWEVWMRDHPQQAALVAEAREYMDNLVIRERQIAENQVIAAEGRLMNTLAEMEQAAVIPISVATSRRRLRTRWWVAAAAVLVIAVTGITLWMNNTRASIHTAFGEVREQRLPDGTIVMLNANSEINYSTGWDKGNEREVWVKGEAFFHVAKTPAKSRFIVHTDQFDVIVTGTRFNVVNRAGSNNVMLTEGSVILQTHDGKQIHMKPGEFVEVAREQLQMKTAREETLLAWRDKKLFFESIPLSAALEKIEEHYGVKISVANAAIGNKIISGILPNDNLDVLLEALEATNEFHVIRTKGEIIITN